MNLIYRKQHAHFTVVRVEAAKCYMIEYMTCKHRLRSDVSTQLVSLSRFEFQPIHHMCPFSVACISVRPST